ncbi:unnamed protein product [Protopolystoma xenopodis]|uniref:Uncharacterized protein n=1 Tax=Protopolystoma xenopodis TaxID=117903 RepID=A0A448WBL9_9PLAT|nr:unnamed protein product [Protopolystoma xenopodis]
MASEAYSRLYLSGSSVDGELCPGESTSAEPRIMVSQADGHSLSRYSRLSRSPDRLSRIMSKRRTSGATTSLLAVSNAPLNDTGLGIEWLGGFSPKSAATLSNISPTAATSSAIVTVGRRRAGSRWGRGRDDTRDDGASLRSGTPFDCLHGQITHSNVNAGSGTAPNSLILGNSSLSGSRNSLARTTTANSVSVGQGNWRKLMRMSDEFSWNMRLLVGQERLISMALLQVTTWLRQARQVAGMTGLLIIPSKSYDGRDHSYAVDKACANIRSNTQREDGIQVSVTQMQELAAERRPTETSERKTLARPESTNTMGRNKSPQNNTGQSTSASQHARRYRKNESIAVDSSS